MAFEFSRIESRKICGEIIGHITLKRLAIPETIVVIFMGMEIIPRSFDIFGHPNFTKEQLEICKLREFECGNRSSLQALVTYEEREFDIPQVRFNTVKGIKKSLSSLDGLNEMLNNRRKHIMLKRRLLDEFVIFGRYFCNSLGQVMFIEKESESEILSADDVEKYEIFSKNNPSGFILLPDKYAIPVKDNYCHCCGRNFTILDLKNDRCVSQSNKLYHHSCLKRHAIITNKLEFYETHKLRKNE